MQIGNNDNLILLDGFAGTGIVGQSFKLKYNNLIEFIMDIILKQLYLTDFQDAQYFKKENRCNVQN